MRVSAWEGCAYMCVRMCTVMCVPVDTRLGAHPCVHTCVWGTSGDLPRPHAAGSLSHLCGLPVTVPAGEGWGPQAGTNTALRSPRAAWGKAEAPGASVGSLRTGGSGGLSSVGPGLGASGGCEFSLASTRFQGGSRVVTGGGHS